MRSTLALIFLFCVQCTYGWIWPTPNPAFEAGEPIEAYIQATSSGRPESGLFGCVRNDGHRFHEAIDLYPLKRDARGEALDPIFAVLDGRVVYVNRVSGHSSYGRYVVLEHQEAGLTFHTLYAHMANFEDSVVVGAELKQGATLGIMGRSSSSPIPKSRAHLHFEIGVRLSDQFQAWYDRQKFGSKNHHGSWNGMNLVSIDPKAFYLGYARKQWSSLLEYLEQASPVSARVRVYSKQVPQYVKRNPALLTRGLEGGEVIAWDIAFSQYGVPQSWTPRFEAEGLSGRVGDVQVLSYQPLFMEQSCRRVVNPAGKSVTLSSGTLQTLKLLFGFR